MDYGADHPRVVALEGATNLRDMGGWRIGAARLRHGLLYRSASLATLTEADRARVAALGLATVVDFRGLREAAAAPSRLPEGVAALALPIEPSVGASLADLLATGAATGEGVVAILRRAYLAYATTHLGVYRRFFQLLMDEAQGPLLFHCSAGKDRTGFGAALILTALGADRATVIEDYVATERFWKRQLALPEGTPESAARALLGTHPALLEEALATAMAQHGGEEGLFREGLGVDRAKLRARLLA